MFGLFSKGIPIHLHKCTVFNLDNFFKYAHPENDSDMKMVTPFFELISI